MLKKLYPENHEFHLAPVIIFLSGNVPYFSSSYNSYEHAILHKWWKFLHTAVHCLVWEYLDVLHNVTLKKALIINPHDILHIYWNVTNTLKFNFTIWVSNFNTALSSNVSWWILTFMINGQLGYCTEQTWSAQQQFFFFWTFLKPHQVRTKRAIWEHYANWINSVNASLWKVLSKLQIVRKSQNGYIIKQDFECTVIERTCF